ncbi:MAG: FAD:protein FMN transferase [Bacteroidales bacterium]|jgi:thiamine biosynthesis lipoprotein|nr:FAD:protein FMN transferase [Bacteroidales bacterium]
MKKVVILIVVVLVGSLFFLFGHRGKYFTHVGFTEGTIYKIVYESPKKNNYEKEIVQLLHDFNASLSTYISNSLISRINQNDSTAVVDDYFRIVFDKSVEINKASGGIFDITIAPIVNLWGFGFTHETPDFDPGKIDSLLQFVGMEKIHIEGNRAIKDLPGVMLDVNAIAKGYSSDVVADFLRRKGCRNYLINIGGEIVARGVNDSSKVWRIGVDRPDDNAVPGEALKAVMPLNNKALATSGNYRRFFEMEGMRYAHTIDVKTGYPVRHNLLSATIIAEDCMTADAWATVCMASGLNKSIELLGRHPELEGLLIYSDKAGNYKVYLTNGMQDVILLE